jgi:hypothetical protein
LSNYKFRKEHKDRDIADIQRQISDRFLSTDENGNVYLEGNLITGDGSIYVGSETSSNKLENSDGELTFNETVIVDNSVGLGPHAERHAFNGVDPLSTIIRTTRLVLSDSPYTVLSVDKAIFCDTDSGDIEVNLPAGVDGTNYKISNCGESGNDVILTPSGTEKIWRQGEGEAVQFSDGSNLDLCFETTEGWM